MYKSLEIVSYENYNGYEEEYQKRVNASSTFETNLSIHPFSKKKQEREKESYNLFYVPLVNHMMQLERIYQKSQKLNFLTHQLPTLLMNNLVISQIFDEIQSTNEIEGVHQGDISEAAINDDLTKLIIFMNNDQCPSLVKAIITHYFFEYVHPFYDGNGRMGRFLLSSYVARKTDLLTGISLSEVINQNRKDYEESFSKVSHPRNRGEITIFIGKLLKLIEKGQDNMLFKLDKLNSQVAILNDRIKQLGISKIEMNLLFVLAQNELFDLNHHQLSNKDLLEILKDEKYARTKLDKAMKELESKGYVTKIKKSPTTYKLVIDFFED